MKSFLFYLFVLLASHAQGLSPLPPYFHEERVHALFGPPEEEKDDSVFVVMPFSVNSLNNIYSNIIKPTVENQNLVCYRADDYKNSEIIMHDVWKSISSARLVIVDLTGNNPSVMYELGIAHALGKDTILIVQNTDSIFSVPFDVKHIRCIAYEDTAIGGKRLEKELSITIQSLLKTELVQPIESPSNLSPYS